MNLIEKLSSYPLQTQTLILETGETFSMTIYYRPNQTGWFINQLTYQDFELNGIRICNSPNLLYQFQNKLPFGLACFSKANREPMLQEDFYSGASKLYVLTEAEVQEYAAYLRSSG